MTDASDDGPRFYRVGQKMNEHPEIPLWIDMPDILEKPRASIDRLPGIPLSTWSNYRFRFKEPAEEVGEVFRFGAGLFLIAERITETILNSDPNSLDIVPAQVEANSLRVDTFVMTMPRRVLDAVDTRRTDVRIKRGELRPGKFRSIVHFPRGISIRADLPVEVQHFVGFYDGNWWWRQDLLESVRSLSVRALRAVPSTASLIGGSEADR